MVKKNKNVQKTFARTLSAALVASAMVPVAVAAEDISFPDVEEGHYYTDAVNDLAKQEILQGDQNGLFNPNHDIDRASVSEVLYKALKLPKGADAGYSDVKDLWYKDAVNAVVEAGIFQGADNNLFRPDAKMTRAEVAKVIVDAYNLQGEADLSTFPDTNEIPGWAKLDNDGNAKDYIAIAVENGIMKGQEKAGTSYLAPLAQITRAEVATIVKRAMDMPPVSTELKIESVEAIDATGVKVTFEATTEAHESAVIEVKDDQNNVIKTKPISLEKGATSATFVFETPFEETYDFNGKWMVNEIEYAFEATPEVPTDLDVKNIVGINNNGVTVTFEATTEANEAANIEVKNDQGEVVKTKPTSVAKGATSATFAFETPLEAGQEFAGKWSVDGVVYDLDVLKQVEVSSETELKTALETEIVETITLKEDINFSHTLTVAKDITLNGNGHTVNFTTTGTGAGTAEGLYVPAGAENVVVEHITITTATHQDNLIEIFGNATLNDVKAIGGKQAGIYVNNDGTNAITVNFKNITTADNGWQAGIGMVAQKEGSKVIANFTGTHSFGEDVAVYTDNKTTYKGEYEVNGLEEGFTTGTSNGQDYWLQEK